MQITTFPLDTDTLPKSLYGSAPYRAGNLGLTLAKGVRAELHRFLKKFLALCGHSEDGVFLRLDAFVNPENGALQVLEINSRFVDGWGSALNLNRLAGIQPTVSTLALPQYWCLPEHNRQYRVEFDLARAELELLGIQTEEIDESRVGTTGPTYYYAWGQRIRTPTNGIFPAYGFEIEDKGKLARFSRQWNGVHVDTPLSYHFPDHPWDSIPKDKVIAKFCEKYGEDSRRARTSVLYPDEFGKGRFAKQCYERGTLIAQHMVSTLHHGEDQCQVVVLTSGTQPITGYTLWSPVGTRVMTDAGIHGPLAFEE